MAGFSSFVLSCLDLVSSVHDQDHLFVIHTCCVCGDPMDIEMLFQIDYLFYHVFVICDLACFPLLVAILAK